LTDVAKKHAGKLVKDEISVNSIINYLGGIKSWLDFNEMPTPYWKQLKKMLPERVRSDIRPYEMDEVRKMFELADVFDRLIICLFVASGARVGGQEGLTFRNVVELQIPEGIELPKGWKLGMLDVYPDSDKHHYYVPLSPEAMAQIDISRQFRIAKGEKVTLDSPLVRDKLPKNEPLSNRINRPKAVKAHTIRLRMVKLIQDAGLPIDQLAPDHSFRYLFNNCLMNSDCKWEMKELMMGHKVRMDFFYYDKRSEKARRMLVIEYLKAMDSLIIQKAFRLEKLVIQLEERLKDVPKLEVIQQHLIAKTFETDGLKKTVRKKGRRNHPKKNGRLEGLGMDSGKKLVMRQALFAKQMMMKSLTLTIFWPVRASFGQTKPLREVQDCMLVCSLLLWLGELMVF